MMMIEVHDIEASERKTYTKLSFTILIDSNVKHVAQSVRRTPMALQQEVIKKIDSVYGYHRQYP